MDSVYMIMIMIPSPRFRSCVMSWSSVLVLVVGVAGLYCIVLQHIPLSRDEEEYLLSNC